MQDPAYEVEAQEIDSGTLRDITDTVNSLPSRQQYALICRLKDNLDDSLVLIDSLHNLEVDPEIVHWPEEKDDKQSLKASLSVVRKKLQFLLSEKRSV